MIKLLYIQFSNSMFQRHKSCDDYWDAFYEKYENIGYYRDTETFELPKWIAEIEHIKQPYYNSKVFYCKNDIIEAIDEINTYKPTMCFFSLMDCNMQFIEEIVKQCKNTYFTIGGYNDYIKVLSEKYSNVNYVEKIEDEAKMFLSRYTLGTDYSLFKGKTVIPRLTMSYGCKNNCKFCIIPHDKIDEVSDESILQQIESFKPLIFKLIYLDDKTFGQAKNSNKLKYFYDKVKEYNKEFNGFIIQTTVNELIKKHKEFKENGVVVAEIGVETYNNSILKQYRKPLTTQKIDECLKKCKEIDLNVIANIIVGFEEETEETYMNTENFIYENLINKNIIGINPAIYTDYSKENSNGEIEFQQSDKIELHKEHWNIINDLAKQCLKKV